MISTIIQVVMITKKLRWYDYSGMSLAIVTWATNIKSIFSIIAGFLAIVYFVYKILQIHIQVMDQWDVRKKKKDKLNDKP